MSDSAGMTNGVAYVLDEVGDFPTRLNGELVQAGRLMDSDELSLVYDLVQQHFEKTASRRAEAAPVAAAQNLFGEVELPKAEGVAPKPKRRKKA